MAKLPDPVSTLTSDARRIYDKITTKRGQMKGGPYASLMHHPASPRRSGVGGPRPDRAHREAAGRRHRADPDAG